MSAGGTMADGASGASARAVRVTSSPVRVFRTERRSQLAIRLLALACVVGPFAFAAVLKVQSGTPTDALLGIWVHSSGFAISLLVLGFAGSWGFPLMAAVLAGDMFSSEERHGTWKTILTPSCTPEEIFAGKVLATMACALGLPALTASSPMTPASRPTAAGKPHRPSCVGQRTLRDIRGQTVTNPLFVV